MLKYENCLLLVNAVADRTDNPIKDINIARIQRSMASLTDREQVVLIERFGLKDGTRASLQKVAALCKVTPERIRQIESKALRRLRNPRCLALITDPTPSEQVVTQPIFLEWLTSGASTSNLIVMGWLEQMNPNGWKLPTVQEIQSAILDETPGFQSIILEAPFWVSDGNTRPNAIMFNIGKNNSEPLLHKKYARAMLIRHVSRKGLLAY